MFRRGSVWLALACAPALAACSLLLGEGFTDTSTPATPDADTNGDSTSTSNGEGGNPQTDGSSVIDGGTAACASDAAGVFCDDFQRDEPQGDWGSLSVNDAGILAIEKSAGSARLRSAITAAEGAAQLSKVFKLTPKRIRIELSLEIETLPTAGLSYIAGVYMIDPPSLFYLYAHGGGVFFVEQLTDGVSYVQTALAVTLKTPHRVVMDVTFGGKAFVYVDGVAQIDKATEKFFVPKPPTAVLGANSQNGGTGISMRIDDYVFVAE